jgi:hypothetical protein
MCPKKRSVLERPCRMVCFWNDAKSPSRSLTPITTQMQASVMASDIYIERSGMVWPCDVLSVLISGTMPAHLLRWRRLCACDNGEPPSSALQKNVVFPVVRTVFRVRKWKTVQFVVLAVGIRESISFIFKVVWKGLKTVPSFSVVSIGRHFHGLHGCALSCQCLWQAVEV